MVNQIPSYVVSAGGRVAVLAGKRHPAVAATMLPACVEALESCGVETDDIYIVDAPLNELMPAVARELSRTGFFSAIVALAVLDGQERAVEAVLNGMTTTDFPVPVAPGMVLDSGDLQSVASVARDAGRAAVQMINLSGMLDEMRQVGAGGEAAEDLAEELAGDLVDELAAEPAPSRRRKAAPAATGARRGRAARAARPGAQKRGRSRKAKG